MRDTGRVSDVVTGEAVALDLRIAQLPSRLVAAVIDLLAMALAYLALGAALYFLGVDNLDPALAAAVGVVLAVAVFLAYPVAMETVTRGRSLGKLALGLRVVRDDGGPITFRHALVRGLVGLALERPGLFLGLLGPALGMIVSMFSARGKRIGDMAAGTLVLQERTPTRPAWAPTMPPPLAAWASTLDLAGLDDELALSVRQFLSRAGELTPAAREALAADLVAEVRARTTPEPPPGAPGWAYLTAVLAERRRREEEREARAAGRPLPPLGWYGGWPVPAGYAGPGPYAGGPGQHVPYPGSGQPQPYAGPGQVGPYPGGQPTPYPGPGRPVPHADQGQPARHGGAGQPVPHADPGQPARHGGAGQPIPHAGPDQPARHGEDG
jgi:uncharacterized RDD family membrane protein YckC